MGAETSSRTTYSLGGMHRKGRIGQNIAERLQSDPTRSNSVKRIPTAGGGVKQRLVKFICLDEAGGGSDSRIHHRFGEELLFPPMRLWCWMLLCFGTRFVG